MAWDSKFLNCGIVKIEGEKVKIYSDKNDYITIELDEKIAFAYWADGGLNITLKNGKFRRYIDRKHVITI